MSEEEPTQAKAMFADFSYNDWIDDSDKVSIILEHPTQGRFGLHASKDEYVAAVARGEVAFSPTEVKALFLGHDSDFVDQDTAAAILQVKKMFPAARVIESRVPEVCVDCGFPFVIAMSGDNPREIAERNFKPAVPGASLTPQGPVCVTCYRDTVFKKKSEGTPTASVTAKGKAKVRVKKK